MAKKENERYKREVKITGGIRDSYKRFRDKHPLEEINEKKYKEIAYAITKTISEKIIKESLILKLPYRLGTISVEKSKSNIVVVDGKLQKNRMIPDWQKTWELWYQEYPGKTRKEIWEIPDKLMVYNMNEHSNGYVYSWVWNKVNTNVKNMSVYKFRPVKQNRLDLKDWIHSDERENDYYLKVRYYDKYR